MDRCWHLISSSNLPNWISPHRRTASHRPKNASLPPDRRCLYPPPTPGHLFQTRSQNTWKSITDRGINYFRAATGCARNPVASLPVLSCLANRRTAGVERPNPWNRTSCNSLISTRSGSSRRPTVRGVRSRWGDNPPRSPTGYGGFYKLKLNKLLSY